jgi:hypothetical protein
MFGGEHFMIRSYIPRWMYSSTLSLTTAVDGGGWLTPRHGRFIPGNETRYPLYRRLFGPPGPVWTIVENLASTGIRSQDRPDRRQSLCRLSCRGQQLLYLSITLSKLPSLHPFNQSPAVKYGHCERRKYVSKFLMCSTWIQSRLSFSLVSVTCSVTQFTP